MPAPEEEQQPPLSVPRLAHNAPPASHLAICTLVDPLLCIAWALQVAGTRIRLYGVDAPETKQSCEKGGKEYSCGECAL